MTVAVWRIAVEAPTYSANDMTGEGARLSGGRWNSKGVAMIYSSANISLAALETLSHLRSAALPFNRFLVRVDIPDSIWERREIASPPAGWDAVPAGRASARYGDTWVSAARSALLAVPSVIIPDESNLLINPLHRDAARITATTLRRWHYDPRFFD